MSFVATKIVQEAVKEDVGLSDLAKLAESDAGFALRVLSIVNSGAFARGQKISNVRQACSFLGVRGLRNVALGLLLRDMVPTSSDGALLLTTSLRRAVSARLIAEALKERCADDAFTAGMFLEIALLSRARADLAGTAQIARMPAAHRPVVERAYGFIDHALDGAKLGTEMNLDDAIVQAIAHHHDAETPKEVLSKIAWAAERVAGAWENGEATRVRAAAEEALSAVGVGGEAAAEVLRRVPENLTSLAGAFERNIDEQVDLDQLAADAHAQLVELNNGYEKLVRRLEDLLAEKENLAAELKRANADLEALAATDPLTKLPNRRTFSAALSRDLALADRNRAALSLVVVDVDLFKRVNDTYGHQTGDAVLVRVAEVLTKCVRASDMVCRFGGEEFVALLSGTDAEGGKLVAERMRVALEQTAISTATATLKVTASFGVASVKGPGCSASGIDLVSRADSALYEAKRTGRNRVVITREAPAVHGPVSSRRMTNG